MRFGIYRLDGVENEAFLSELELELGVSIASRSVYRAWNHCTIEDDREWFASLAESPRDVLLTWEPWNILAASAHPEDQPDFSLKQILSGRYDSYVRDVARTIASLPVKVYLRPLHEMNGNWYPWCGTVNGNSPAELVPVWHHLRKLFVEEHATAVEWVWSPYASSYPDCPENEFSAYYPGDDAVGLIGLDGYNWGNEKEWGRWQSFTDLFSDAYRKVTELGDKAVIVAETASAEGGGDKSAWIGDMLDQLTSGYPRIEAVFWFDIDKECDWRLHSSGTTLKLFRERAARLFGAPR
jgi:beta-mannanase